MRGNMKMKKRNLSQEKIIDCFRELAEEMDVQQITFQHLAKRLDIKAPRCITISKIFVMSKQR